MKFSLMRPALALGVAAVLASCGGGKAMYPVRVTVINPLYEGLILSTNGQDYAVPPVSTAGATYTFSFPNQIEYGTVYNVIPKGATATSAGAQPKHMQCAPGQIPPNSGTAGQFQSIDITYNCTLNVYPIGGTIKGLKGTGLVLINGSTASAYSPSPVVDASNVPTGADITFTMPSAVTWNTTYGVTVLTQPTSPAQTCTVANGTGTIDQAVEDAKGVTNIIVTCQ